MAAPEETGFVLKWGAYVASGVAAIVSALAGRILKKHDEEIASIKSAIKSVEVKVDAKLDKDVWEQNRREARENVVTLHSKIEQIGLEGERRHRELMQILLERRNSRRSGDD